MAVVEGVIARATRSDERCFLTVFPFTAEPDRWVDPNAAIDLEIRRQNWQTETGHNEHVSHMIGRSGVIEYCDDNVIQLIRTS